MMDDNSKELCGDQQGDDVLSVASIVRLDSATRVVDQLDRIEKKIKRCYMTKCLLSAQLMALLMNKEMFQLTEPSYNVTNHDRKTAKTAFNALIKEMIVPFQYSTLNDQFNFLRGFRKTHPELPPHELVTKFCGMSRRRATEVKVALDKVDKASFNGGAHQRKKFCKKDRSPHTHKKRHDTASGPDKPARLGRNLSSDIPRKFPTRDETDTFHLRQSISKMVNSFASFEEEEVMQEMRRHYAVQKACKSLCSVLKEASGDHQYRGKNFSCKWMEQFGHTVQTIGCRNFELQHNFRANIAARSFDYDLLPEWKQQVWQIAKSLVLLCCPELFGDETFVITVSRMDSQSTVGRHRDPQDIGPQLIVSVGDFEGGEIRLWSEDNSCYLDATTHNNPIVIDGRLDHYVHPVTNGNRYGMFVYKMVDPSWETPRPLLDIVREDPRRQVEKDYNVAEKISVADKSSDEESI
ncbi:MAG: hypothetical protein ACRDL7_00015 [Gaiellaceae bacterium]